MLSIVAALVLSPQMRLDSVEGKRLQVLPSGARLGTVFLFALAECPISNAYAPEVNRIAKEYKPKGWEFYVVYADSPAQTALARKHHQEFGYAFPGLIDPGFRLVDLVGATRTPEAAVLRKDGSLAYRGRIDNLYAGLGKRRPKATTFDLRNALDAVAAGKPVPVERSEVIGCVIPRLDR